MTENTHENPYFDLITTGVGYLNRARTVKPRQGAGYECVAIAALRGHVGSPEYTYLDCRIVGEKALEFVSTYKEAINDRDTKVLVRFNVGDGAAESYEIKRGENQGQRRHQIKGRLLKITWAKVGDQEVYLGLSDDSESTQPPANTLSEPSDETKPRFWKDTIGDVVTVAEDDLYYDRKIAYLQENGYQWHGESGDWRKAA